jgi:hypothetical protein
MSETAQTQRDDYHNIDAYDYCIDAREASDMTGALVIQGDQATLFGRVGRPVPSEEPLSVPLPSAEGRSLPLPSAEQLSSPPAMDRARPPNLRARAAASTGPVAVGGTVADLSGNWATGR